MSQRILGRSHHPQHQFIVAYVFFVHSSVCILPENAKANVANVRSILFNEHNATRISLELSTFVYFPLQNKYFPCLGFTSPRKLEMENEKKNYSKSKSAYSPENETLKNEPLGICTECCAATTTITPGQNQATPWIISPNYLLFDYIFFLHSKKCILDRWSKAISKEGEFSIPHGNQYSFFCSQKQTINLTKSEKKSHTNNIIIMEWLACGKNYPLLTKIRSDYVVRSNQWTKNKLIPSTMSSSASIGFEICSDRFISCSLFLHLNNFTIQYQIRTWFPIPTNDILIFNFYRIKWVCRHPIVGF